MVVAYWAGHRPTKTATAAGDAIISWFKVLPLPKLYGNYRIEVRQWNEDLQVEISTVLPGGRITCNSQLHPIAAFVTHRELLRGAIMRQMEYLILHYIRETTKDTPL